MLAGRKANGQARIRGSACERARDGTARLRFQDRGPAKAARDVAAPIGTLPVVHGLENERKPAPRATGVAILFKAADEGPQGRQKLVGWVCQKRGNSGRFARQPVSPYLPYQLLSLFEVGCG